MGTKKRSVARRSPGSRPRSAATVAVVPAPVTPWVIGVGASAGGLRALEELLAAVPPRSGLAFLIVQHLDPTHRSDLPELLQRQTSLPVQLARQGTVVAPDTVHVLPPNREMTVENGRLRLRPGPRRRACRSIPSSPRSPPPTARGRSAWCCPAWASTAPTA